VVRNPRLVPGGGAAEAAAANAVAAAAASLAGAEAGPFAAVGRALVNPSTLPIVVLCSVPTAKAELHVMLTTPASLSDTAKVVPPGSPGEAMSIAAASTRRASADDEASATRYVPEGIVAV
jgi:hypothetical protein